MIFWFLDILRMYMFGVERRCLKSKEKVLFNNIFMSRRCRRNRSKIIYKNLNLKY